MSNRAERQEKAAQSNSMALLGRLLEADEPAYRSAHARQERVVKPAGRRWLERTGTGLTGVAIGLVLVLGAQELRVPTGATREHQERLVEQVRAAEARVGAQEAQRTALASDVDSLRARGAAAVDRTRDDAIVAAAARAGHVEVTGEGVVLTLDDRAAFDSGAVVSRNGRGIAPERIHDRDLLAFVNVLWGAGAEAISVNGHRLTALSTIRFAGEALIVDFSPLAPPYEVRAIGPATALADACSSGTVTLLRTQLGEYGVVVSVTPQQKIVVPAGSAGSLWAAKPGESAQAPAAAVPTETGSAP